MKMCSVNVVKRKYFVIQLLYRLPLEEVRERTLQVTVWNYNTFEENEFLGAMHLRIAELDLSKETTGWFPLQNLHKITTS